MTRAATSHVSGASTRRGHSPARAWRSLEAVEFATLEWVDWFNTRRRLEPIGHLPPAAADKHYFDQLNAIVMAA